MSRRIIYGVVAAVLITAAGILYFKLRQPETDTSRIGPILTDNGFVELRPPSNLFKPGTWVEVLASDPLHLSIVCNAETALGLNESDLVSQSESLQIDFLSELKASFSIDAEALEQINAGAGAKAFRSLTFSISNIKLLELPDDVVVDRFQNRSEGCREAIKFRFEGDNPVSMIKSVLIADVTYTATFNGGINARAKAKAIADLAINLGVVIGNSDDNKSNFTGKQLIWGVRDDVRLAAFGQNLPSTGNGDADHSILRGKGPITDVRADTQARNEPKGRQRFAAYDVAPLKQRTRNGCWATAFTMLKSWRDGRDYKVEVALKALGAKYVDYFARDTGLPGGSERDFVRDAGMSAQAPANYSLAGLVSLLQEHGPLWIIVGNGINSHALVLVGVYGTELGETKKAYDDAVFEFIDPLVGGYVYITARTFMSDFEKEAVNIVNSKADDLDLRWQILHWPALT